VKLPQIGVARPWWRRRFSVRSSEFDARAAVDALLDALAERMLWARYGLH
jgi:hypothetical protein